MHWNEKIDGKALSKYAKDFIQSKLFSLEILNVL